MRSARWSASRYDWWAVTSAAAPTSVAAGGMTGIHHPRKNVMKARTPTVTRPPAVARPNHHGERARRPSSPPAKPQTRIHVAACHSRRLRIGAAPSSAVRSSWLVTWA